MPSILSSAGFLEAKVAVAGNGGDFLGDEILALAIGCQIDLDLLARLQRAEGPRHLAGGIGACCATLT